MDSAQWKQAGAILLGSLLVVVLISVTSAVRSDSIDREKSWIAALREWLFSRRTPLDQARTPQERAQAYLLHAMQERMRGQFSEAISNVTAALKLPVDRQVKAELLELRGGALMCQHRYPDAVEDFRRELQLRPEDITGYYNRGVALAQEGRYEAAKGDLVRFGMSIGPYYARSEELTLKDPGWRPFRRSILQGLAKGEGETQAMYHRGMAFVDGKLGRYVAAAGEVSKAIKLTPNAFLLYRERAKYQFLAGDWRKAWNDYMGSIRVAWAAPRRRHHRYEVC